MKKIKYIMIAVLGFAFLSTANSQTIEDALRIAQPNGIITPRAASLSVAFHGISDDFSAVAYNPAGLALINRSELNVGLGFLRNNTETLYLDRETIFGSNDAYVSHAGMVVPFSTSNGNAAIAVGYFLESNFDNNIDYSGFNQQSTMINHYAKFGPNGDNKTDNMAYFLWLTDEDLNTPITDSLRQESFISETGGLHNVSGSIAFSLSEFVSIGGTLSGKWGNFRYDREYSETDIYDKYNEFHDDYSNIDFHILTVNEVIEQTISGLSGSIGVMGRVEDFLRFGVTVKFPTYYEIDERFSQEANATFDNGETVDPPYYREGETSYKVHTPFIYAGGVSIHAAGITFSVGGEYTDVTQMEFSDAPDEVMDLNRVIVQNLIGQATWGFGIEYDIPLFPGVVRGSYSSTTSPYAEDIPGASFRRIALGGGIYLAPNIRLDGVFQWTANSQLRTSYSNASDTRYIYDMKPLNMALQLTYRY
jgi:hypothetical protein